MQSKCIPIFMHFGYKLNMHKRFLREQKFKSYQYCKSSKCSFAA